MGRANRIDREPGAGGAARRPSGPRRRWWAAIWLAASAASGLSAQEWTLDRMVSRDGDRAVFHPRAVDESLSNPWPPSLEEEFQRRAQAVIAAQTRDTKVSVNTYFENEKRSYGFLMAHVLGGDLDALPLLQSEDHQHREWHRETEGIDFYACFTLKHQMRKYFYFGDLLEPGYRQRMLRGGRKWTASDPLRRPHYAYQGPKEGWGPDARNSWVDVRSTENLYLMRLTSVYLMAEEAGNQDTAAKYKAEILRYAATLYRIGMGEWDSENYLGHSLAPLLNLYDFARDRQVQAAAKACLDWMTAAGAVKYWRGGFNGPGKRDYNHAQPLGGSAANSLWLWFGGHPRGKADHWESDEVHQITSGYRPPLAVVQLARKNFSRPLEIFAAKPAYEATTGGRADSSPQYAETQYIANSYLMGSLTGGTSTDGGDVNGFKILADHTQHGAVALHAAPTADPLHPGSPMYRQGVVRAANRIAQQENLAIWLVQDGASPWLWVIPDEVQVSTHGDLVVLRTERAWFAVRTLGGPPLAYDDGLTRLLRNDGKRFPNHKVIATRGRGGAYCGLAIEAGESQSHGSYEQFLADAGRAEVDLSQLEQGVVRYKAADGKWLGLHWAEDPLEVGVWRNGRRRDLRNLALYDSDVIAAPWGQGSLSVRAGGAEFQCTVGPEGTVEWDERNTAP